MYQSCIIIKDIGAFSLFDIKCYDIDLVETKEVEAEVEVGLIQVPVSED